LEHPVVVGCIFINVLLVMGVRDTPQCQRMLIGQTVQ